MVTSAPPVRRPSRCQSKQTAFVPLLSLYLQQLPTHHQVYKTPTENMNPNPLADREKALENQYIREKEYGFDDVGRFFSAGLTFSGNEWSRSEQRQQRQQRQRTLPKVRGNNRVKSQSRESEAGSDFRLKRGVLVLQEGTTYSNSQQTNGQFQPIIPQFFHSQNKLSGCHPPQKSNRHPRAPRPHPHHHPPPKSLDPSTLCLRHPPASAPQSRPGPGAHPASSAQTSRPPVSYPSKKS